MGLLDRWIKKNEAKQLSGADKKPEAAVKVESVSAKKISPAAVVQSSAVKITPTDGAARAVLVKPLVTEKSAIMESLNKYSFLVAKDANKQMIKQAVEEMYGIKPLAVNVVNMDGRQVRFGRVSGRRGDYRKAVVTLPKGKSIAIHEGV